MKKELEKPKKSKSVILQLIEQEFPSRREFVLQEAESVAEILERYPALFWPDVVRQLMCAYCCRPELFFHVST